MRLDIKVKLHMTTTSDGGVSCCRRDATPKGFGLWRALDVTVTHSYTHGL